MAMTGSLERALTAEDLAFLRDLGQQLRVDGIRASTKAGSGHPTSSMSASDLLAVLIARHLHYDWKNPHLDNNDHLIFSKGHASPLIYAVFKACGAINDAELMTYRTHGVAAAGPSHPNPAVGRRRHRLARPGPAHRRRSRAGRPRRRQAAVPCLDRLWRLRDRRGLDLGGARQGRSLRPQQLHRHRRRQPPRPAWTDRVRVGHGHLPAPCRGLRLPCAGHRRPRRRADRRGPGHRAGRAGAAHRGAGPHHQRQGIQRDREQGRLARQGPPARHGRTGDR